MLTDMIKATGQVRLVLRDKNGVIQMDKTVPNMVVTVGKNHIAGRMVGTPTVMSHMAIGTNATAVIAGDTALGTEVGRVSLTSSTAVLADITYIATFGPGVGTGALTEAGILNAGSAGTMLCRTTFGVFTKSADDTLTVTWKVTIN